MTIYPLLFHLGPIEITGYGIMMMIGFLMAGWVMQLELRRRKLNEEYSADIVMAAVIGGIIGAKLWYVALTGDPGALFSRAGLVWYGGFLGGLTGVVLNGWRRRVPLGLTAELTAPALALGYALGRVGCFLIQDDYGIPTSLPWAMRFPEGSPPTTANILTSQFGVSVPPGVNPVDVLSVHPTQLYEVTAMLVVFAILWRLRRHRHTTGWLFGLYLLLGGLERFLVEFLRAKDDRFLGMFTVAQLTSVLLMSAGVYIIVRLRHPRELVIPEAAAVLLGKRPV